MFKQRRLNHVFQTEIGDCGLACLVMVLGFHGYEISLVNIKQLLSSSLQGNSIGDLKKLAQQLNLTATVMQVRPNQLYTLNFPIIAHWEGNHFIVIKKITSKGVIIHDPAKGLSRIPWVELSNFFTGFILEILPGQHFKSLTKQKNLALRFLTNTLSKKKNRVLKIFFVSLSTQFCLIASIKVLQQSIDAANGVHVSVCILLIITLIGLKIYETISGLIRSLMIIYFGFSIQNKFTIKIIKHLIMLPIGFFEKRHLSDLISRYNTIERIRQVMTEGVVETLIDVLISVCMILIIGITNIYFAIIISFTTIIITCIRYWFNYLLNQQHNILLHYRSQELSQFMENIRGITATKIFSREFSSIKKSTYHLNFATKSFIKFSEYKIIFSFLSNLLLNLDLCWTLALGCVFIEKNNITIGTLYALLAYRQSYFGSLMKLADKIQEIKSLFVHLDKLNDILSSNTEQLCPTNLEHVNTITLKDLSFSYLNSTALLQNLSLTINKNTCVAITGPSGSGKTTLLKIMMGLLKPSHGNLYLNSTPVYPNHIKAYRKKISAVLQEDILLSGTIAENISFFDKKNDMERVHHCAKLACIFDEIKAMPLQFSTYIGGMASCLSGGQKQRILLARAIYSNPEILFLDEATSHLDLKKEYEINQALRKMNITIIFIAHRPETIKMADIVVNLESFLNPKII